LGLVEFLEELVPGDLFEALLAAVARKIDADDADVLRAPRALDRRWFSAAGFGPGANGLVIRGDLG
jgi:hypothetical protein